MGRKPTRTEGIKLISPAEMRVLKLMAKGLSSKQAAKALFLSVDTVQTHRKNMLRKMGAANALHLIDMANKNGLL